MSLQGTLETIPLPDVLSLLAATSKSGELRISAARAEGRLWFDAGRVVAADVPRAATPVDAVFELLRVTTGTFSFDGAATATSPGKPIPVEALLHEAQERLRAWKAIESVVPSVRCTVALAQELAGETVTLSARQWKDLVAVASGGDVNGIMRNLGVGEFEACRTVKDLVDAGLVKVGQPPEPERDDPKGPPASPHVVRPRTAEPRPAPTSTGTASAVARAREASKPAAVRSGPARPAAPAPPASVAVGGAPVGPSREEAEELVHQLAALGRTPEAAAAATAEPGEADPADEERDQSPAPRAQVDEEPINRGMLLKFLSSVRP